MKNVVFFFTAFAAIVLLASVSENASRPLNAGDMAVADVLVQLGDDPLPHQPDLNVPGVSAAVGEDLVMEGRTKLPGGGLSDRISRHFVCTACHNVERDEPDLSVVDPLARLKYDSEMGLPFLQGSALYGIVNRTSFYNGDYYKKYGDLVKPTRHNLREAIQLCATQCSQGRLLKPWELESILAYLWTIDLKMYDLNLSPEDILTINRALRGKESAADAITLVKSKYLSGMPATFIPPPEDRRAGYSSSGDPETGKMIYELSCLHCHENKRFSFLDLDNSRFSFEFLSRHFPTYSRYSVYQVARYGTPPIPWKKAYMPQYTQEKMTEQMLEDLRAYIEQRVQS
ncbi:MAG: cytochrome c [Saprospiraceae bacterium]